MTYLVSMNVERFQYLKSFQYDVSMGSDTYPKQKEEEEVIFFAAAFLSDGVL
jgi:hypothetical protein